MLDEKMVEENPIASTQKIKSKKYVEDSPRSLNEEEVRALLAVSPVRRPLYMLAVMAGLRRKEIKQLKVADIVLEDDRPYIFLRHEITKNGKSRRIDLHSDLVEALRSHIKGKGDAEKVFTFPTWKTFNKDLGRAKIVKRDAMGRKASFHSLRHTFNTQALKSGIPAAVVQDYMGHSEIGLTTNRYKDSAELSTADFINQMPSYTGGPRIAPRISGSEGQDVAHNGAMAVLEKIVEVLKNKAFSQEILPKGFDEKWWAIQNSNL